MALTKVFHYILLDSNCFLESRTSMDQTEKLGGKILSTYNYGKKNHFG